MKDPTLNCHSSSYTTSLYLFGLLIIYFSVLNGGSPFYRPLYLYNPVYWPTHFLTDNHSASFSLHVPALHLARFRL